MFFYPKTFEEIHTRVPRIAFASMLTLALCASTVLAQSPSAGDDDPYTFRATRPPVEATGPADAAAAQGVRLAPVTLDGAFAVSAVPPGGYAEVIPAPPKAVVLAARVRFEGRAATRSSLQVNSGFGVRRDPITGRSRMHTGVDLKAEFGRSVGASLPGKVLYAGYRGGYGNLVVVDHGQGIATMYAHLSSIAVTVGQRVLAGEMVGCVGSTGRSTGPHLHYEIRARGCPLNPSAVITFDGTNIYADGRLVSGAPIEGGDEVVAKSRKGETVAQPPLPLFETEDSLTND